jgi:hypothetical protein
VFLGSTILTTQFDGYIWSLATCSAYENGTTNVSMDLKFYANEIVMPSTLITIASNAFDNIYTVHSRSSNMLPPGTYNVQLTATDFDLIGTAFISTITMVAMGNLQ